ncbi:MAG TPA: TIGR00725 family protein [Longimicrobiales bacterium]|nr:TIGR00725 family protein [Longimicrobiales bacterium]
MTAEHIPARPPRIAVCGAGICGEELMGVAESVGRGIAEAGGVVLCGGHGGVMEGAARGATAAGGLTIGILATVDPEGANPYIQVPLPTGMGDGRNILVVRGAQAVIAIGGEWGTLSEVALARKVGVPTVLLRPGLTRGLNLPVAEDAEAAVRWALDAVESPR